MASIYTNLFLQMLVEVVTYESPSSPNNGFYFVNNSLFEFMNGHDTPPEHTIFQEPP